VTIKDLPEADQFSQLASDKKHLMKGLFQSAVDLRPDQNAKTLTVRLHKQTTAAHDAMLKHVCAELNEAETLYPGTDLRLVFQPVG